MAKQSEYTVLNKNIGGCIMKDKIKRYYELNVKKKTIENEKTYLSNQIKDWMMNCLNDNYLIVDGYTLRLQERNVKKYDNNNLIEYLKENGYSDIIETKEVVNTSKLQKLIKNGSLDNKKIDSFKNRSESTYALYLNVASDKTDMNKYRILEDSEIE